MGDIKVTLWKGMKAFIYAAVPAGLIALAGVPEFLVVGPILTAVAMALENWFKHRNDL